MARIWLEGHLQRLRDERMPKRIFQVRLDERRPKGGQRKDAFLTFEFQIPQKSGHFLQNHLPQKSGGVEYDDEELFDQTFVASEFQKL